MTKEINENKDLYQSVTDSIVKMIEEGRFTQWRKSWSGGFPTNLSTGMRYRGINVLLLINSMIINGFAKPYFLTLKQANKLGGKVKKGEPATPIIYWNIQEKELDELDDEGKPQIEIRCYLRRYYVFNVAQIEDIDDHIEEFLAEHIINKDVDQIDEAEKWLDASGAIILRGGHLACYVPQKDKIFVPDITQFDTANDFYSAVFHELAHWTGHKSRLNRGFSERFGDQSYAFEELIAELTSSFIDAELGFSEFKLPQHVNYIANWLKVLKNDKNAIFTAASQASLAFEYLADLRAKWPASLLDQAA